MIEIREYLGRDGRNLFGDWFVQLNSDAARLVTTAHYRVGLGNFSDVKGVGGGVFECCINSGPDTAFTSGRMGSGLSFCSAAERRSASRMTSNWRVNAGWTTNG